MSYEIFDFINSKDGSTYDIQTSNKIFKDVLFAPIVAILITWIPMLYISYIRLRRTYTNF